MFVPQIFMFYSEIEPFLFDDFFKSAWLFTRKRETIKLLRKVINFFE